ncbi:hypothetical protein MHF_0986 [Mycoplasma haemofelis Ohio2]|uniref:Lipoprotein n=1 Tax=Mycoplasma haemofelis (strain Ohio2) TaxID=859194 RepID=F6FJ43_MYCHI|nr:hypothetical protein MHF_0986 [Mycoplasma haemofelis Ohio2]
MPKPKWAMASGAGLCGAAGVGCGAYFLSENLNSHVDTTVLTSKNKTIKAHLQGDGFEVLDVNKHHDHWTTLTQKYKELSGKLDGDDSNIDESKLKGLCQEALEKDYVEGSTYDQAIKWCIVPVTITSHLQKGGYTAFTTDILNKPQHKWVVDTYDNGWDKISSLDAISKDASKLISECTKAGGKHNYEKDFYRDFVSIRQWCFTQYP